MNKRISTILLFVVLFASFSLSAQTVVAAGSNWTYDDTNTNLGTTWREVAYGDLVNGPSPAHFGYGTIDGQTNATTVTSSLACYYFRKDFTYNKTGSETAFNLEIMYDDGAAIYINGVEVHRTALMPTAYPTEVFFTDECTGFSTEGAWDSIMLSVDDLADGANTIAVEVHNDSPASSDIGFDLRLTALTSEVDYSTQIRWGSKNSPLDGLTITWTGVGSSDKIKWGYTIGLEQGEFTPTTYAGYADNFNDYTFPALTPNSTVYYQIYDSQNATYGNIKTYETAPASSGEPYTIIAMGDSRDNMGDWQSVASAVNIHDPAAVIFSGDIVGDGSVNSDWDGWFSFGKDLIENNLFYHTIGNHETYSGGTTKYLNNYVMPDAETGTELYYAFEYGDAVFINLNSEAPSDGTQLTWLQNTLAANQDKTWKIVWFHCPFYTSGSHEGEMDSYFNTWWKAFDDYGVDLIFNGHDHMYERTLPINRNVSTTVPVAEYGSEPGQGRCQIVTGGAGAPLYNVNSRWWLDNGSSTLHYCKLDIDGVNMTVNVYDNSQSVIDQFTLVKAPLVGVAVTNPVADKTYPFSGGDVFDISNVFKDFAGDSLTLTLETNTDPTIATVSLVGTTLTIAASGVNTGATTITLKGEDVTNSESATDVFVVTVFDPFKNMALDFDGVDEVVDVVAFMGVTGTTARTVEAWIKASPSMIGSNGTIIKWGTASNGNRWAFRVNSTGGLRTEVWGGNIIGTTDLLDDQWHHVAVTWENDGTPNITDAKLYVDGVLETIASSVDEPINTSIGITQIGGESDGYFDGCIDEIRVWDTVRTETEISNNKFTLTDPESEANLVAYYRFDREIGSVLPAIIGGHDGSLSNMEDVDWVEVDYYSYPGGPPDLPDTPTNVVTSIFESNLIVDWTASAGATSYDVYSSDDPYGTFTYVTSIATNQYTVAADQAKLFYYIVAKNATKK